VFNDVNLTKFT